MWCGVLGPLAVRRNDGDLVEVTGPVRRRVLAALISRANETVPADALAAGVWGQAPPRSSAKTLQSHLVRLRDDLGRDEVEAVLLTEPGGYRLALSPGQVDALRFLELSGEVLAETSDGDVTGAIARCDTALGLWRGDAYCDFPDAAFAIVERLRLTERHDLLLEHQTDLRLAAGQSADLVGALRLRAAATPYRERVWEQLVLALYRCGRSVEALEELRRVRAILATDLGVDPGPDLTRLELSILRHDPHLGAPANPRRTLALLSSVPDVVASCPYRGLSGYGPDDGAVFVGRERAVAQIASWLADHSLVVVTGASGAGKSSLVRAGLVPALRAGALPSSAAWHVVVTDVRTPIESGAADVVIIDQAEELFTALDDVARANVVAALTDHVAAAGRAVLVLRGDFYGRLAELGPLAVRFAECTVLVGPMREEELRRVVSEPARRAGVTVDADLVDDLIDASSGQPAVLPLLSVALVRAWENREGTVITQTSYQRGGGITGALQSSADDVYEGLDATAQRAARLLLVRLTTREGVAWIRRSVPLAALDDGTEPTRRAVRALTDGRLITVGPQRAEIVHDALLEHWPRLREWLQERAEHIGVAEHVTEAAAAWRQGGHQDSDLLRGTRLLAASDWSAAHPEDLTEVEAHFVRASVDQADRELGGERARADREARGRRRLRYVVAALVAVLVVLIVVGTVAVAERGQANARAREARAAALSADARRVAALSLTAPDLRTSLLLATEAYRLQDSSDTRAAVLASLEKNGSALSHIATGERVEWIGVDRDGQQVWAMDNQRRITRYIRTSGRALGAFSARADRVVAMSPDARTLVVAGPATFTDTAGATRVTLLDAKTGAVERILPVRGVEGDAPTAAFTGDGRHLAVIETTAGDPTVPGRFVAVFDLTRPATPPRHLTWPDPVVAIAAGRSRIAVRTSRGRLDVVDAADLRTVVAAHIDPTTVTPLSVGRLALAPTGRTAVFVNSDQPSVPFVIELDARRHAPRPSQDVGAPVTELGFSPTGDRIGVAAEDGAVTLLNADGSLAERTAGEAGSVLGASWFGGATDGGFVTGGLDSQIVSWDLPGSSRLVRPSGPTMSPDSGDFLFGDHIVGLTAPVGATSAAAQELAVYDRRTGRRTVWPLGLQPDDAIGQIDADDGGARVLLTIQKPDQTLRCEEWSLTTGRRLATFVPTTAASPHNTYVGALSADGRTAAVSIGPHRIGLFALPSGRRERTVDVTFPGDPTGRVLAYPVHFAPSGRLLVAGFDSGPAPRAQRVGMVDLRTGALTGDLRFTGLGFVSAAAWSPDHRRLAVGTLGGELVVADAASLRPLGPTIVADPGSVGAVSWSRQADTVLTSGTDGSIAFWDAPSLRPIASPLHVADSVFAVYDSADDRVNGLETGTSGQRWFTLPSDPAELVQQACAVAGTPFTRDEWRRFVGSEPYRPTC